MRTSNSFNDLKTQLTESDIDQIVALVGSRCGIKTLQRLRSILTYGPSSIKRYGPLERLHKTNGNWIYYAGQSYPDEIRTLRECILGE